MTRAYNTERRIIETNLRNVRFERFLFKVVDPNYIKIKVGYHNDEKGFYVSVIQHTKEAKDIMQDLTDEFRKKSTDKFRFLSYSTNDKNSIVTFFCKLNLFDRTRIINGFKLTIENFSA